MSEKGKISNIFRMMPINLEISAYYNKSILSSAVSRTDSELENKVMMTFLCDGPGLSSSFSCTGQENQ